VFASGKIYAVGGDTGSAKTAAVEIYDPAAQTWTTGASMGSARSHFGCGAEPETGFVYVFGGEDGTAGGTASIERYDPALNLWITTTSTLPTPLRGPLCLLEGRNLRLFGGQRPDGRMSDLVLSFEHRTGAVRIETCVLPYAARDLFGCTLACTWSHRGAGQTDEHCLLGGGFDGT
ncbi:MAG: kelch repeat-containing protein, partial [Planctomycetes bacterium]|nr:kelch repeat-containing protein [Planctomycetota bacterium]